jgi:cation:H+ antiporter
MTVVLFVIGLMLLILGAEVLVKGASRLASVFRVSPLVIGLTVVAFGTSSPELAVSIQAATLGQASIAVGNVIGSNIFNVLFILGCSALIVPLIVSQQLIRFDVPLMIGLSVLVLIMASDGILGAFDGSLLVLSLIAYIAFVFIQSRKAQSNDEVDADSADAPKKTSWIKDLAMVAIGLAMLVIGSDWLVDGAVALATHLGVSQLIIGLTIVAAGTSLPEVVTSIVAAVHGERDIAVGNVVGSNLFNIMGVLGVASLVAPGGIDIPASVVSFDLLVMLAVAIACLPIFFSGGIISRQEGALLLAYYVAYTVYLVFSSTQHALLESFSTAMLYFVIPLSVLAIGVSVMQHYKHNSQAKPWT